MSHRKNIVGHRFGRLVVISFHSVGIYRESRWLCLCDCGNTKVLRGTHLKDGGTRSCGCLLEESRLIQGRGTHLNTANGKRSPTYVSWNCMLQRVTNPKAPNFNNYGGRGIKVCKRWLKFEPFLADMGERPVGLSLDRINNDGNYTPRNCRWATAKEQRMNQRIGRNIS